MLSEGGTARFWATFICGALETDWLAGAEKFDPPHQGFVSRWLHSCHISCTRLSGVRRTLFAPHHSGSRFLMRRIALPIFSVSGMRSAIAARKEAADPHTEETPMGSGLRRV
jgi:hypothetical protein